MKYRTRKVSEIEVDGKIAELSFEPSPIMDYVEHKIEIADGLVVVGYLVDDQDVSNPLEDCDAMGHIYTAHRHSRQHEEMQSALGLNSEWEHDTSLSVVERSAEETLMQLVRDKFQTDLVAYIIDCANNLDMSRDGAIEHFIFDFTGQSDSPEETWLTMKVREVTTWETLLDESWHLCRKVGLVGDPYSVMLDCYEHGGQVWSLSGSGMQCQFDTARGAGVWVPDDVLREELDEIRKSNGLEVARSKAVEFAGQALESYNAWLSGDCYGVAVDVFVAEGDRLKRIDDSSVWGYIGRRWAEEAMGEEVMSIAASAKAKVA